MNFHRPPQHYPQSPGWRGTDTSRAAAKAVAAKAKTQRQRVLETLQREYPGGLSSDEIAERSGVSKYAVRSRVAELQATEPAQVRPTAGRTKNESGHSAIIWIAAEGVSHVG